MDNNTNNIKLSSFNTSKVFMSDMIKNGSTDKDAKSYILRGVGMEILNNTYYLQPIKDKIIIIACDKSENISDILQIPEVKKFFNYGCHSFNEVSKYLDKAYSQNENILIPKKEAITNKTSLGYNHNTTEAKSIPPEQIDNVNKISEKTKENAFIPKSWKATKEFMFDPQHIIGDDTYRSISQVKNKVDLNLQAFFGTESSLDTKSWEVKNRKTGEITQIVDNDTIPPQFIAAHYLMDLVDKTCETGDPSTTVEINDGYEPLSSTKHLNSMKLPDTLTFDKNTPGYAKEVVKLLDDKPTEIISPIVVLKLNNSIFPNDGGTTKNTLLDVFGVKEEAFHNGLISYPAASEELVDSYCAIKNNTKKYSILGVSTKGGYDGRGAQASTISLFRMVYKDPQSIPSRLSSKFNLNINYNDEQKLLASVYELLSDFGKNLYNKGIKNSPAKDCQVALTMLTIFGGSMVKEHIGIIDKLKENNIFGLNDTITSLSEFCHYINDNYKITDCIMNILDSQKYKFAQLNCKPKLTNNVFGFDYKIQYPAHFEGTVTFEPRGKGIGFHILGKVG